MPPTRRIAEGLYYSWSKEFLEAGKKRLRRRHRAPSDLGRLITTKAFAEWPDARLEGVGRRTFPGEPSSLQKKHDPGMGEALQGMRYPASPRSVEIIRPVEQSHLGVGSTLDKLGIPLKDHLLSLLRSSFWPLATPVLRIATAARAGCGTGSLPDDRLFGGRSSALALGGDAAVAPGTGRRGLRTPGATLVSEASVYRLLKAHGLITSPAFEVIKAEPMSSATRPRRRTSCGRPTSPISRSSAGAGFTCRGHPGRL